MDSYQQREQDLKEHIKEDLELQKKLEDKKRCENDEKEKKKLEQQIEEVKNSILNYKSELESLPSIAEQESLNNAMTKITFVELDMVTNGILRMPLPTESNYNIIPPIEKMSKNELTGMAQQRLMTGVIQANMVSHFVEHMVKIIPDFAEKLKAGFVEEYMKFRANGLKGNDLLYSLHEFSCNNSQDDNLRAAGLAVLYYFFEKCELFER
ncbi:MAG: hypothetical protein AAF378_13145 [Cyanobacteria bacterium P01_A01_bin.84]